MPAPVGAQFAQLSKLLFSAKQIAMPVDWADLGGQFSDAFELSELIFAPNPPTNLFKECCFSLRK